jgi:hypothetical protein
MHALFLAEVLITRRQRNAIAIANNLNGLNAHGHIQVTNESANNRQLLGIFLTKERNIRTD